MRTLAALGLSVATAAFMSMSSSAQNMEAMQKWAMAKVVHYHVSGDFSGSTTVLKNKSGDVPGKVSDHVEVDFDWDQMQQKLSGDPVFKNFPTKLESVEKLAGCPEPKVDGPVEYFTFTSVSAMAMMFEFKGTRSVPSGSVPGVKNENDEKAKCGEIWIPSAAATEPMTARMQLGMGMMLAMPATPGFEMEITKDGKSFIQKINTDGWVWTMTPTIVR